MSDLKVQGVVEMNAEGAERALDRVGDKAAQMASKVGGAADKAGTSVDKIGDGAGGSAEKMTRAEGRMVASIKRVQTQMELAGKTASQKFEFNIQAKGLDPAKFEPYLAQLRAAEIAQARVSVGAAEMAGKMAGLAAVAAGGAFTMWIRGAIDAADSLNDLSKSTSIAVETLAGLKLASNQSGAELEGTAQAINKLSVNMGANAAKFAAIGVTAKEPLEAFKQLSDVFTKIEDPQMRAAFAAEALGKSWASAAPLLSEGGKSIHEMVEKGTRLSGVTQDLADDADAFNDVLEEWKAGIAGVASGIAGNLLPVMLAMSQNMGTVTNEAENMRDSFSPVTETLRAVAVLGGNVAYVLNTVGKEFGGMAAQVKAAASGDFAGARDIGKMITEEAVAARAAFDRWEEGVMSAGKSIEKTKNEVVKLTEAEKESIKVFADSKSGKTPKAAKEDFSELFQRAEQMKAIYASLAIEFKEIERANLEYAKAVSGLLDPLAKEANALETEAMNFGLSRTEIEANTLAKLEEAQATAALNGASEEHISFLQREIELRKRIRDASANIDQKKAWDEARKASDKAASESLEDWKKTSEKIGDSITDALMRGFESGKGFAENLRNTIVNMFQSMVLRPTIQATVVGGLSAVGLGANAATGAAGTLSDAGSVISTGNSAFNLYNGASGLTGGFLSGMASVGSEAALGAAFVGPSATLASGSVGVGASVGSAFGTAASGIAAAIPVIGGALAIGSILGLFGGNDRVDSQGAKVLSRMTAGGDYSFEASKAADDYNTSLVDPAEAINKTFLKTVSGLFGSLGSSQDISFQTRMSAHGREGNKLSDGFELTVGDQVAEVISHAYGEIGWDELIGKSVEWAMSEGIKSAVKLSKLDESIKGLFSNLEGSEQVGKMVQNISALGEYSSELNDVWGISIAQASKVATTVSETNEALISNVGAMAVFAAAQRSIGETLSTTYEKLSESFAELSSADFPSTLAEYDAAMKAVDKTAAAGIKTFSDLFALREQFAAFQAEIDTIRASAEASVLSYRTDGDKAALAQEALAEASRKAGVSVITSAGDLLRLADSIDYTTEAGINLALALPTLAAAFNNVSSSTAAVQNAQASRISAYLDAERAAQAVMIENQRSAYEDQLSSAQSIADEFRSIVESLTDYRRSLLVSEDSTLTPEQKYNETKRLLELTTAKARLGDVDAAGKMQAVTDDFLSASKAFSRTSADFAVDFGTSIANLDAVIGSAGSQASYAERQIALAQAQLDALNSISAGLSGTTAEETGLPLVVDNFAQAMKDWQDWFIDTAIGETDTYDIGSTTRISQDKGIFTDTAGNSYVFSASDGPYGLADQSKVWAEEMLRRYGQWMAPGKVKGYASGGDFSGGLRLVGENGPELEVTKPSHIYSNADTKNIFDISELVAEVKSLREELRAGQAVIANNTKGTTKLLERAMPDGDALAVRTAA